MFFASKCECILFFFFASLNRKRPVLYIITDWKYTEYSISGKFIKIHDSRSLVAHVTVVVYSIHCSWFGYNFFKDSIRIGQKLNKKDLRIDAESIRLRLVFVSLLKKKNCRFFFLFYLQKMVLVLNGVLQDDCPSDTVSLFMQHPVYRDYANQLVSIPTKTVSFYIFICFCFFF